MADKNVEYLRILSIFHYVVAGITALFSLLPTIHLFLGIALLTGSLGSEGAGSEPPPMFVGAFMTCFALLFILAGLTLAACIALTGVFLARRNRYYFCLVVAGIETMIVPFGTALGVFTIVVLVRDEVRAMFGLE